MIDAPSRQNVHQFLVFLCRQQVRVPDGVHLLVRYTANRVHVGQQTVLEVNEMRQLSTVHPKSS